MNNTELVTVQESCEILDNMRIPLNAEERSRIVGNIPYYGANGVQGYINDFIFDEELILLAEDGGYFEEFDTRPIAYKIKGKSWVNNHAHILRAKDSFSLDFVFYSLQHKNIISFIKGGTRSKLNQSELKDISFWKAPLSQQQKIAKILTTVDNLIEQTQALIDKYTAIKQGMMADLFTRGIDLSGTPETNPNHGQLRPSFEKAPELYKETELGWVPRGWEVKKLGDISHRVTDGSHQSVQTSEDGDVAFLFVSCIRNGKILWDKAALISRGDYSVISKGREPKKGDILYTAVGSYGHAACVEEDIDFTFQRHIAYIKPDTNIILSELLAELLNFEPIRRWADSVALGNAQKTVTLGELTKFPIVLPTLIEQSVLMNCLQQANAIIDQNTKLKQKYGDSKKGLMQDLLTGKVQVTA